MPHIVFAWTAPALLAGVKTVIRQPWSEKKAHQFHSGALVAAYDRAPNRGGRPLAVIRLTADPIRESLAAIPDSDYDAEGWRWLNDHSDFLSGGARASDYSWDAFQRWRARAGDVWVVRYEIVALVLNGQPAEALTAPTTIPAA